MVEYILLGVVLQHGLAKLVAKRVGQLLLVVHNVHLLQFAVTPHQLGLLGPQRGFHLFAHDYAMNGIEKTIDVYYVRIEKTEHKGGQDAIKSAAEQWQENETCFELCVGNQTG